MSCILSSSKLEFFASYKNKSQFKLSRKKGHAHILF